MFPSAELFKSCDTEALSPSINNPPFCCPPAPDNHPSTFCLYEFYISPISGIIHYLHFCYWLISLGLMSSRFIHIVACDRFSFVLRLNDISFYAWTTFAWASLTAQLVKNPPAMWETWVLIPGLGRSPGEGKGYPLQSSGLENFMDCVVHGVTKS